MARKMATDRVTGAGAKYVKSAMKNMPLTTMLPHENDTPSTSHPAMSEVAPAVTPVNTGTEHLSAAQFSPPRMSMHPGGASGAVNPVGKRPSKMSMHPGGGQMFTPSANVPLSHGSHGGNVNPHAPMYGRIGGVITVKMSLNPSSGPKKMSSRNVPASTSQAIGKLSGGGRRTRATNTGPGRASGGRRFAFPRLKASRHAGKNQTNLNAATNSRP